MKKSLKKKTVALKRKTVARAKPLSGRRGKKATTTLQDIKGGMEGAVHSVEQAAMKVVDTVKHVFTSDK